MEEIIGLLIALGAIILKVVGNRLEKSGKKTAAPVTSDKDSEGGLDVKGWILEALEEAKEEVLGEEEAVEPEPVFEPVQVVTPPVVRPAAVKPVAKPVSKPILLEETPERKGEKIDPKKLVIYSEIMKPKYTE